MQDHFAIVFDFDGTLVDSNHIKTNGFYDVIGSSQSQRNLMSSILASNPGDRSKIFSRFLSNLYEGNDIDLQREINLMVQKYTDYVDIRVVDAPEIDGAKDLLASLRQKKIKVIVSSATPEINLKKIIKARGWNSYFDCIFGAPNSKIETVRYLLSKFNIPSQRLSIVGDGFDDRISAEKSNCKFFPVGSIDLTVKEPKVFSLKELKAIL